MKHLIFITFLFLNFNLFAQKPCDFNTNINDSIGSYKVTKDYLIYEQNFAGNSSSIFFSLALTDGTPTLNTLSIQKSKGFVKANCLDKNSKMYLQLMNGKIITMVHIDQDNCGTSVKDDKGFDNRLTTGFFMFLKGSIEDLKKSPVSFMRIKYTTETIDYVFKKELTSEMDNKKYSPEDYFINSLHCID